MKIKNIISFLLAITILVLADVQGMVAASVPAVTVKLNNTKIVFEVQPKTVNKTVLVQLTSLAKALGATTEWQSKTKSIVVKQKTRTITLTTGKAVAIVNGKNVKMPCATTSYSGKTFVPLTCIAQQMGAKVAFTSKTNTYTLTVPQQATADYIAWQNSVKGIPAELLNNSAGLVKPSVYESYKYLREVETDYLKNWGAKYTMSTQQFENEMVRVGSKLMNTWYNANYTKINELKSGLTSVSDLNFIKNDLQNNLDYVKNNKFVAEGKFITSTGLLVFADWGNPVLRGTIKYRYLSPTSTNVLKSEIVGSTGKSIQLGVWYEQDIEIQFLPEREGLKVSRMDGISKIRLAK